MRARFALLAMGLAASAPAGAQPSGTGATQTAMQAMRYYVDTWNCIGGAVGRPPATATVTYAMDGDALRDSVVAASQGPLSRAWMSVETKYDAVKHVYVDTAFDNGGWDVSYAKAWTGNTEEWTDQSTAGGKLGRDTVVRVDNDTFVHTYYATPTETKPDIKFRCSRSR